MDIKEHLNKIKQLSASIGRPVKLMEVCGTHTVAAFRSGLRSLLPENVSLLSGPGCPVCVTPNDYLDRAIAIASQTNTTVATFGDMLRVPGTESSLELARAQGADIQVVYSPLEALAYAQNNSDGKIIFLGVGFETTTPAIAWTIKDASEKGINNYYVLSAHKTVPPAMAALLQGEIKVDGFICPGHVSVIIGAKAYDFISRDFHIPCVVTGFEPSDMMIGIEMLLQQMAGKRAEVEIQYSRSVNRDGNQEAQAVIQEVFEECDTEWRGVGLIPRSGLAIRGKYNSHDATELYKDLELPVPANNPGCICGEILRGIKTPYDCKLFNGVCSPTSPVGACMVSSEGTCAAYFKYAKRNQK
jgi:hydrogenase expression/formation protein HypD